VQVRPLYTFLQREIQARASSPIVDRVMYDDVNEFFWLQERFKAMMPPADGHAGAGAPGWVGVPQAMRGLPVEQRLYAHLRAFLGKAAAAEGGAGEAGGLWRTSTRPTLNRRTKTCSSSYFSSFPPPSLLLLLLLLLLRPFLLLYMSIHRYTVKVESCSDLGSSARSQ